MLGLDRRLGGPVGRHAVRRGRWFDPATWSFVAAGVLWVLLVWRHKPCQQHTPDNQVNAFIRFCYSDVPVSYQNTPVGVGASPLSVDGQNWPPLTRVFMLACQHVARLFGARAVRGASSQQVVNGASVYFLVTALALFCCFCLLVACTLLSGRDSARMLATTPGGRLRSWDALLVGLAPVVFTSALVSWDLFAVALTSAALLAWALDRGVLAGVLFGLAILAGLWPALVLLGVGLAAVRARTLGGWGLAVATAAVVVGALTALLWRWGGNPWAGMLHAWLDRGPDLGSFWYVAQQGGVPLPTSMLSAAVAALFVAWVGWVALVALLVAPRRPRVAQVAFLLVAGWLLVNKGYSPQQVLWLVPLVPLAHPVVRDWAIWSAAEVVYWAAVWAHLGNLTSPGDGSPDVVYWCATLLRVIVLVWLCQQVAHDMREPWDDPVRAPGVDDPIGGPLDHAVDDPREARGELVPIGAPLDEVHER